MSYYCMISVIIIYCCMIVLLLYDYYCYDCVIND